LNQNYFSGAILTKPCNYEKVFDNLYDGSHLVQLCTIKTYHRTAIAIEDVGFEIRDMILYLTEYGEIPIVLARKPITEKTITDNVLKYGTGAINIDKSRILMKKDDFEFYKKQHENFIKSDAKHNYQKYGINSFNESTTTGTGKVNNTGRFPANLIHDGSDEIKKGFPDTGKSERKTMTVNNLSESINNTSYEMNNNGTTTHRQGGSGNACRYFKELKDYNELMDYLINLIGINSINL